jgi:hypothetical protein
MVSVNCARDSYESVLLGGCIWLDANAGAGEDDDGDVEALDGSKRGEEAEGLMDDWTEAVRLTGLAWGLVAFLSLDEKGGEGVEDLGDG